MFDIASKVDRKIKGDDMAVIHVEKIFKILNLKKTDKLSLDEFLDATLKDQQLYDFLVDVFF